MNIKNEMTFNQNSKAYDSVRPGYPLEMYKDVKRVTEVDRQSKILDIGAGTGLASLEMFNLWHSNITLLDPGENLLAIAKSRFRKTDKGEKVDFHTATLKDFLSDKCFDLVTAATSFHWLSEEDKVVKLPTMIKKRGFLAVFWNNYSRDDKHVFDKIQSVYNALHPNESNCKIDVRERQRDKITERVSELKGLKAFKFKFSSEYLRYKNYSSDEFIKLQKTFSPNAIHDKFMMRKFYDAIFKIVEENGGELCLPILTNIVILQKE